MSGFEVGDKVACINLDSMLPDGESWATKAGCRVGGIYTIDSVNERALRLKGHSFTLPLKNFKLLEERELNDYYETNGDVVEAARTGDVFLFLGGMYYNLTSGGSEMRGRKSIRREDGPLKKLSNIANSGNLFKEAIRETAINKAGLHVEEMLRVRATVGTATTMPNPALSPRSHVTTGRIPMTAAEIKERMDMITAPPLVYEKKGDF